MQATIFDKLAIFVSLKASFRSPHLFLEGVDDRQKQIRSNGMDAHLGIIG